MRDRGRRGGRGSSRGSAGLGSRAGRVTKRPALPFRLQKELAAKDSSFTGTREFGADRTARKSGQNNKHGRRSSFQKPRGAGRGPAPAVTEYAVIPTSDPRVSHSYTKVWLRLETLQQKLSYELRCLCLAE